MLRYLEVEIMALFKMSSKTVMGNTFSSPWLEMGSMHFGFHLKVSKSLYQNTFIDYPMSLVSGNVSYGRSTVDHKINLLHKKSNEVLVSAIGRTIYVDPATRRPVNIPQSIIDGIRQVVPETRRERFPVSKLLGLPDHHFKQDIQVMHDDMNIQFHTNQASYSRFAENCAAAAVKQGFYKYFTRDICFYHVKLATILHLGESFSGDHLTVYTWQDEDDLLKLYFMIKKDSKLIFQAIFCFYTSGETSKL